jgi:uncharacterized protein
MTAIPDDALRETWDSIYQKSVELAERIETYCRDTGEQFDAIIVVPRGSYYPANIVSRELGFKAVDLLHACVSSYETGSASRDVAFKLGQMPSDEDIAGKHLLIIEEVCDTGHTLNFLYNRLRAQGAASIRTGVLHYKPGKSETSFAPDWFITQTDAWIVYPWEAHEARGKNSKAKRASVASDV